jgi:hypothetical protein
VHKRKTDASDLYVTVLPPCRPVSCWRADSTMGSVRWYTIIFAAGRDECPAFEVTGLAGRCANVRGVPADKKRTRQLAGPVLLLVSSRSLSQRYRG